MDLETVPDTFEYPASPECQVNAADCTFDVEYLCHDCGRQLCSNCAKGIKHQPRLFKYTGLGNHVERTQIHCPDCEDVHDWNVRNLAIAVGGVGIGVSLLVATGGTPLLVTAVAVLFLVTGGVIGYLEYTLKKRHETIPRP